MGQANFVQSAIRFGENDGTGEGDHTFIADINTAIDCGSGLDIETDATFLVRFVIQNTGDKNADLTPQIEYDINGAASWANVGADTPVYYTGTSVLTDGNDSTKRVGVGSNFLTNNNWVMEGDSTGPATTLTQAYEAEVVVCLRVDLSQFSNGDYVELKVTNNGSDIDSYTNLARIDMTVPVAQLGPDRFRFRPHGSYALSSTTDWNANESVDATTLVCEQPFEIVMGIQEENGVASSSTACKYQYRVNAGSWTDLNYTAWPAEGGSVYQVSVTDNTSWADGAATSTQRLSGTGTYTAGVAEENATFANIPALNASGCTEMSIQVIIRKLAMNSGTPTHIADGATVDFRVVESDGTELSGTKDYPRVTVANDPGLIGGVMTETPNHIGPFCDGNGNLYCMVEFSTLPAPEHIVMKSTDGGDSWAPGNLTGRPTSGSYGELEAARGFVANDRIYMVAQEDPVSHDVYITSDAGANPDTWETVDQAIHSSGNPADQGADIVRRSDGDLVAVFTDTSTNDRIYFKEKISGSWDASPQDFEVTSSIDWSGPSMCVDANDKAHVLYKDHTNDYTYYNTIDSGGTPGSRTQIMTDGAAANVRDHLPMRSWSNAGSEYQWAVYRKDADGKLYGKLITDGTPGSETSVISANAVATDIAGSQCPAATLVQDGNDTYIIYADSSTQDLYYIKSSNGGAWGGEAEIKDGITADIISADTFTHAVGNGGAKVIGLVVANGSGGFTGDVRYYEYEISAGTEYTQAVAGAITPTGDPAQKTGKLTAGSLTPTGAPTKKTGKLTAGSLTPTGAPTKKTSLVAFAGSLTPAGVAAGIKIVFQAVAGAIEPVGTLARKALINLAGAITPTGAQTRKTKISPDGALTPTGAPSKKTSRTTPAGAITPAGVVAGIKKVVQAVAGALTPAGALLKKTAKSIAGSITPTGAETRKTSPAAFSGSLTPAGGLIKSIAKAVSGALGSAGSLARKTAKALVGALGLAGVGAGVKQLTGTVYYQAVAGALAPAGTLARKIKKAFAGALTAAGAIIKAFSRPPGYATLTHATLYGVSVSHAGLYGVGVSEAGIYGIGLSEAGLYGISVSEAVLYGINLEVA